MAPEITCCELFQNSVAISDDWFLSYESLLLWMFWVGISSVLEWNNHYKEYHCSENIKVALECKVKYVLVKNKIYLHE